MPEITNLLGAVVTVILFVFASLVFTARLINKPELGYWIGIFILCLAFPMVYLLVMAPGLNRPLLYYLQLGLMITWLAVELLLDYILKSSFRRSRWKVIAYVTLFFAGCGGMVGVAANAGKGWCIASIILFFVMTILAFMQRAKASLKIPQASRQGD